MTVNPGATGFDNPVEWAKLPSDRIEALRQAYLVTYRGPHGDAPDVGAQTAETGSFTRPASANSVPTELLAAHFAGGASAKCVSPSPTALKDTARRCRSSPTPTVCRWIRRRSCCTDSGWPTSRS